MAGHSKAFSDQQSAVSQTMNRKGRKVRKGNTGVSYDFVAANRTVGIRGEFFSPLRPLR
jgi:hypothetical protein